jgi:hypothetical protein
VNPTDPRDSQIAALESQCAALQREILALKSQVDPATVVMSPQRSSGGSATLEIYWKVPNDEFTANNVFQAIVPLGGFVSRRFIELPPNAAGQVRIDPGNLQGLFLFTQITLHDVDEQGALVQPAVLSCEAKNGFKGLTPITGCTILPVPTSGRHAMCKVLAWDSDPQLLLRLPDNRSKRARILTLAWAALDPAHAIMAGHGQDLFEELARLTAQLTTQLKTQQDPAN